MGSIIRFSMKNAVALVLIILMIGVGGVLSIKKMNIEEYPNVDIPYLGMFIMYPGASAEQAMNDVGKPLTAQLKHIDGIKNIYAEGFANGFHATLEFGMDIKMDDAERNIRDVFSKVKLPETVHTPQFQRQSPSGNRSVFSLGIHSEQPEEVQQFVKDVLIPQLESIKDVDAIELAGEREEKIYVQLRPDALVEHQLTLDQVKQAILANNLSLPTGEVTLSDQLLPIRVSKKLHSLDDVKNINILFPTHQIPEMTVSVSSLKLSDIADISYGNPSKTNFTRINGQPGMILSIIPSGGANVVSIVKEAKEIIAANPLPSGVHTEVLRDQSIQIETSVFDMLKEAILGAVMAMVVTLLFLRNVRSTLIAIISIPLSILASFIVLQYMGYTLNLITLSGIAVAVGRVVDDSIVVIENIFRRLRKTETRDEQLVVDSTREVANAITSSTITTVAVFIPLAFVNGIVGGFFAPLAWTIVIALLFSLIVAVTIVPFLAKIFLLKIDPIEHRETKLQRTYRKALSWSLAHRVVTLSIAVILLVSSIILLVPKLGFNFLPQDKVLDYSISMQMPVGTAPEKINQIALEVEESLHRLEEVRLTNTIVSGLSYRAFIDFVIDENTKNPGALIEKLRDEFDAIDELESISVSGVGSIGGAGSSEFVLIVNGPNIEAINEASAMIIDHLKPLVGLADLRSSSQGEKPEILLNLNEEKMMEHGLYPAMVGLHVRNLVSGDTITNVDLHSKSAELVLGLKMEQFDSLGKLGEQKITNMLGAPISLNEIATFEQIKSPRSIVQLNQKEYVMIIGTITDANSGAVLTEATKIISDLQLPQGVTWYKEGTSEVMNEGFKNMGIALVISILLVYLTMMIAFGEATAPFVILFAIPFSTIGALLGLYVMNQPIGMPAMVGLLMLNGIVVTNAIVLVDRVKQNERIGMRKHDALLEAGATRLRPILMTAIATIGALSPMMFTASGSLLSKSLAVVVVGGLITSTLLTLIIVPVLYSVVTRDKHAKSELNSSVDV